MTHWSDRAACRDFDTRIWFPDNMGPHAAAALPAKAICAVCEVRGDCLADALVTGDEYGIRGGLTPNERARIEGGAKLRRLWCGFCSKPFEVIVEKGREPRYCSVAHAHESKLASQRRSHAKARSA